MTICYLKWRDASHSMSEWEIEKIEPCVLEEVGWLIKETDEALTLAIESPEQGETSTRLWLCVPKVNILERKEVSLENFLKIRGPRVKAKRTRG